jgi:hypothetical protein
MTTKRKSAKKATLRDTRAKDVEEFMSKLTHSLKPGLEAVRSIILGVSPEINEGIKWNSPSFRVQEYFATINVRKDIVHVMLHLGAKVKDNSTGGLAISDPTGLLEWHAKERASVKFPDMKSIEAGRAAFENIVRQWILYVK